MSISGTRGLVRVSKNPACTLQAAMAVEQVKEPEFYRSVTGKEYPGEYGERPSARRRGSKFEGNLHQNDAALLKQAVGPTFGLDPADMVVRNFAEEIPGPPDTMRWQRLNRMWRILKDQADGKPVPHLLIQPQLQLPTGEGRFEFVSPDFMVLDERAGTYVPGEEKSFIVRRGVVDSQDLDLTRRQAAAQILALRALTEPHGISNRVQDKAVFVFATPYGLKPSPAVVEPVEAEIREILRALKSMQLARRMLEERRRHVKETPLRELVDELPHNFQESCYGSCVMAAVCEARHGGTARVLGDAAADLLGPDASLDRLAELLAGLEPATAEENEIAAALRKAAAAMDVPLENVRRRRSA